MTANGSPTPDRYWLIHFEDEVFTDEAAALRSDIVEVPIADGYNRKGGFVFAALGPMPAAILTAQQRITWSDR